MDLLYCTESKCHVDEAHEACKVSSTLVILE